MRETKKVGKRLPTDEEFRELKKEDWGDMVLVGYCNTYGSFLNLGHFAHFWSSTESGADAFYHYLNSSYSTIHHSTYDKNYGFSVRCIKE